MWAPQEAYGSLPRAKLTEAERETYREYLDMATLAARFGWRQREALMRRIDWSPESLDLLDRWFALPEAVRDRILSSFD